MIMTKMVYMMIGKKTDGQLITNKLFTNFLFIGGVYKISDSNSLLDEGFTHSSSDVAWAKNKLCPSSGTADAPVIKAYCYTKRQFRTFSLENVLSVGPIRRRGVC